MPYRVDPATGMIECDGAEEALALASIITRNGSKSAARRLVPRERTGTDLHGFIKALKPNAKKILAFMLQEEENSITLEELKKLLDTDDGKTVGGTITSITRTAQRLGMDGVITRDVATGIYGVAKQFREAFDQAGKPKI